MTTHPSAVEPAPASGNGAATPSALLRRFAPARCRKAASWVFAVLLLLAITLTTAPGTPVKILIVEIAGIAGVVIGVLGRIWCSLYIAGRKNAELCTDGPYSVCRNPLYLFSCIGVAGLLLTARLPAVGLLFVAIFWVYHHFVIQSEERRLEELFGAEYENYRRKVPRIIPRFRSYWSRPIIDVDARLIRRALSEVAWFLVPLGCLEVIEHIRGISAGLASLPVVFTWPF